MKIILSRKGFDSSYGGAPSPILPDGTLLSLPIPSSASPISYDELFPGRCHVGSLVEDLTGGRVCGGDGAHLDPDLREPAYGRGPGWRPLFGQDGTAQAHLRNSGVGVGDLFLFFGWFRETEATEDGYRFVRGAADLHVIFGWLQIDRIMAVGSDRTDLPVWMDYHPHLHGDAGPRNTLYVAGEDLLLPGVRQGPAGGGALQRYHKGLRLTAPGRTRSWWRLPKWFFPGEGRSPMTYHGNRERWKLGQEHAYVRSACRGQEFVLDAEQYPEALTWVDQLISGAV